jgi:transposase
MEQNRRMPFMIKLTCQKGHVWREGYERKEEFFRKETHPCPECGGRMIGARVHGTGLMEERVSR